MNQQITTTANTSSLDQWAIMKEQAKILLQSGFLPKTIQNETQAIAIMLKGRELGIPPMYALSNVAIIGGKPVAGAEVLQAIIYRDQGDSALVIEESTDEVCTISYKRRGWEERHTYTFTIDMARKAGLLGKEVWKNYPAAMLRARCISAVARMAFADSIGGMYTPEELGATANPETGEIEPGAGEQQSTSHRRHLRSTSTAPGEMNPVLDAGDVPTTITHFEWGVNERTGEKLTRQTTARGIIAMEKELKKARASYIMTPEAALRSMSDQELKDLFDVTKVIYQEEIPREEGAA